MTVPEFAQGQSFGTLVHIGEFDPDDLGSRNTVVRETKPNTWLLLTSPDRVGAPVARGASHRTGLVLFAYGSSGQQVATPAVGRLSGLPLPSGSSAGPGPVLPCWLLHAGTLSALASFPLFDDLVSSGRAFAAFPHEALALPRGGGSVAIWQLVGDDAFSFDSRLL